MRTAVRVEPTDIGPCAVFCRAPKSTFGVGGVPTTALALLMNQEGPSIVGGGGICGTLPPPPPPLPCAWVPPGPWPVAGAPDVAGPTTPVPPQAATATSTTAHFRRCSFMAW